MDGGLATIWQDAPANYHCGGCGFSFADGNSEIKKWRDGRTLAIKTTYVTSFLKEGSPNLVQPPERTAHRMG